MGLRRNRSFVYPLLSSSALRIRLMILEIDLSFSLERRKASRSATALRRISRTSRCACESAVLVLEMLDGRGMDLRSLD